MEKPAAPDQSSGLRLSQRDIISLAEEKSKDEKAAQMKQALDNIFKNKKEQQPKKPAPVAANNLSEDFDPTAALTKQADGGK